MSIVLVRPARAHLDGYVDALERGWSPDNIRLEVAAREHLAKIAQDADAFLAALDDPEGKAGDITLPNGETVKRLPGFVRWIWDGGFAGSISLRFQPGTEALPDYVLGHIGYAVPPWKRNRGYATAALRLILPEAAARGLRWVELTTDRNNLASHRVILAAGGELVGPYVKLPAWGGGEGLKWRIATRTGSSAAR